MKYSYEWIHFCMATPTHSRGLVQPQELSYSCSCNKPGRKQMNFISGKFVQTSERRQKDF